jgi:hypothetical protein
LEIQKPGVATNVLVNSPLLSKTGSTDWPKVFAIFKHNNLLTDNIIIILYYPNNITQVAVIPGSGNLWIFSKKWWAILDKNTAAEVETVAAAEGSCRSGSMIGAGVLLPMKADATAAATKAEFIIFGGSDYNYFIIVIFLETILLP